MARNRTLASDLDGIREACVSAPRGRPPRVWRALGGAGLRGSGAYARDARKRQPLDRPLDVAERLVGASIVGAMLAWRARARAPRVKKFLDVGDSPRWRVDRALAQCGSVFSGCPAPIPRHSRRIFMPITCSVGDLVTWRRTWWSARRRDVQAQGRSGSCEELSAQVTSVG